MAIMTLGLSVWLLPVVLGICEISMHQESLEKTLDPCQIVSTSCESDSSSDPDASVSELKISECWSKDTMQISWKFQRQFAAPRDPVFQLTLKEVYLHVHGENAHCYNVTVEKTRPKGIVMLYMPVPGNQASSLLSLQVSVKPVSLDEGSADTRTHSLPVLTDSVLLSRRLCQLCKDWSPSVDTDDLSAPNGNCSFNVSVVKATTLGVKVTLTDDEDNFISTETGKKKEPKSTFAYRNLIPKTYKIKLESVCDNCENCNVFTTEFVCPFSSTNPSMTTTTPTKPPSEEKHWLLILVGLGLLIVLMFVVLFFILCKRRRHRRNVPSSPPGGGLLAITNNMRENMRHLMSVETETIDREIRLLNCGKDIVLLPLTSMEAELLEKFVYLITFNDTVNVYTTSDARLKHHQRSFDTWLDYLVNECENANVLVLFLYYGTTFVTTDDQWAKAAFNKFMAQGDRGIKSPHLLTLYCLVRDSGAREKIPNKFIQSNAADPQSLKDFLWKLIDAFGENELPRNTEERIQDFFACISRTNDVTQNA